MNKIELAKQYIKVFFETQEFDLLYNLFAEQLDFKGPFFQSETAKEYIESLKSSHWEKCRCAILEEYEDSDSACLIYLFQKGEKSTIMAQQFWCTKNTIHKIRLIFNPIEIS